MQPYRLIGAAAFAIAAVLYVVLGVTSRFDGVIHIATAVVFAMIAVLWIYTYVKERSRPSD